MNILLVEDEDAAMRRLEKIVRESDPDAVVVQRLDSVEATVNWLSEQAPPDLIFMDIHLADGSAFEIFEHVKIQIPVIFTTAYDEYTLKAFKVNAIDYLMKPIKTEEVKAAMEKYKSLQRASVPDYRAVIQNQPRESTEPLRRVLVRLGQSLRLIEISDVAYFFTRDKMTFLVARSSGKRFPVDQPLDKLELQLNSKMFFRINRQFIVNIHAIREMHPYSKSRLKIDLDPPTDMETIVSTERSAPFKQWLVS